MIDMTKDAGTEPRERNWKDLSRIGWKLSFLLLGLLELIFGVVFARKTVQEQDTGKFKLLVIVSLLLGLLVIVLVVTR